MKLARDLRASARAQRTGDLHARATRMQSAKQASRLLDAVELVLQDEARPLSAREMSHIIKGNPDISQLLGGVTPHKTIQARISIDILQNGDKSRFYRQAPGTFGLRYLLSSDAYAERYRYIFRGIRRRQQISKDPILCVRLDALPSTMAAGFYHHATYPLRLIRRFAATWLFPQSIDPHEYAIVYAFVILRSEAGILTFEPTEYEEKHLGLSSKITIGLQGVIQEGDVDLFDATQVGFHNAVEREVADFLHYFGYGASAVEDVRYLGLVRDDSSADRSGALGIVACATIPAVDTQHRRLGYKGLRWRQPHGYPNDFAYFDGWSQYVYAGLMD